METLTWSNILLAIVSMVLTTASSVFIPMGVAWAKSKIKDAKVAKYVGRIGDIIVDAVIATNQTYVDTLKGKNMFDETAQKVAFEKTKSTVLALVNSEAKAVIVEAYGDFDEWLVSKIESTVGKVKQ